MIGNHDALLADSKIKSCPDLFHACYSVSVCIISGFAVLPNKMTYATGMLAVQTLSSCFTTSTVHYDGGGGMSVDMFPQNHSFQVWIAHRRLSFYFLIFFRQDFFRGGAGGASTKNCIHSTVYRKKKQGAWEAGEFFGGLILNYVTVLAYFTFNIDKLSD